MECIGGVAVYSYDVDVVGGGGSHLPNHGVWQGFVDMVVEDKLCQGGRDRSAFSCDDEGRVGSGGGYRC